MGQGDAIAILTRTLGQKYIYSAAVARLSQTKGILSERGGLFLGSHRSPLMVKFHLAMVGVKGRWYFISETRQDANQSVGQRSIPLELNHFFCDESLEICAGWFLQQEEEAPRRNHSSSIPRTPPILTLSPDGVSRRYI